jgi:predicted PurR-regulated permease PerM
MESSRWEAEPPPPEPRPDRPLRPEPPGPPGAPEPRAEPGSPLPEPWTLGFVARAAIVVAAVWAVANLLWMGRELLFVAFFAALFAAFLSIFVDRMQQFGAPRAVAALTVLVVVVGGLIGAVMLAWPTLQDQLAVIRMRLPEAVGEVTTWLERQYEAITGELGQPDGRITDQLRVRMEDELAGVVAGALPLLNTVVGAVAGFFIVVFAGLYLSIEPAVYTRGITRLFPPRSRETVQNALAALGVSLRRWMLGTVINMIAVGTATTVGLLLLDVPAALGLGLIAALLEFIPIFGPIIATVPAVAVAFIVSPTLALYVLILFIVVQQLESYVLTPLVMKGAVKLPPALTMLFQAFMAVLFGFLGLLLAVPILAAGMVLVHQLYVLRLEQRA